MTENQGYIDIAPPNPRNRLRSHLRSVGSLRPAYLALSGLLVLWRAGLLLRRAAHSVRPLFRPGGLRSHALRLVGLGTRLVGARDSLRSRELLFAQHHRCRLGPASWRAASLRRQLGRKPARATVHRSVRIGHGTDSRGTDGRRADNRPTTSAATTSTARLRSA